MQIMKPEIPPQVWHVDDFLDALRLAAYEGNVCTSGQFQWRTPQGTFEAEWLNIVAVLPEEDEPPTLYVRRAVKEFENDFTRIVRDTNFSEIAREWEELRALEQHGADLSDYLFFVASFQSIHDSQQRYEGRFSSPTGKALLIIGIIGMLLQFDILFRHMELGALVFVLWGVLPYGIVLVFTPRRRSLLPALFAVGIPLAFDIAIRVWYALPGNRHNEELVFLLAPIVKMFLLATLGWVLGKILVIATEYYRR